MATAMVALAKAFEDLRNVARDDERTPVEMKGVDQQACDAGRGTLASIEDEPVLRSAMHAVDDDGGYDDETASGVTDEWDREGDEAERQAAE